MTLDRQRTRALVQALLRARNMREGGDILENAAQDTTAIDDESYGKPPFREMGFISAPQEATTGSEAGSQLASNEAPGTSSRPGDPQNIYSRPLAVNARGGFRPGYWDLRQSLSPPYRTPNRGNLTFPPLIYQGKELTEAEKDACHDQFDSDREQCYKNYSYNLGALGRCIKRAVTIRDLCLRGKKEILPWSDVDEDGVRFPKPGKGQKRK